MMPRLRSSEMPNSLVLFVAGEPEVDPGVRSSRVGFGDRLARMVVPGTGYRPKEVAAESDELPSGPAGTEGASDPDARPWHLPPGQMACLQVVLDSAERLRQAVLVIDVDRPGAHQNLVDASVGSEDVLPILVRADGARLQGQESFAPAAVRRFLMGR